MPCRYREMGEREIPQVLEYFEQRPLLCLYSYIDLKKFGLSNPHFRVYVHQEAGRDGGQEIKGVLTRYYGGVNAFCGGERPDEDAEAMAEMVRAWKPDMLNGPGALVQALAGMLGDCYAPEYGYVTGILDLHAYDGRDTSCPEAEEAAEEELMEVARLICTDDGLGGQYTPEGLCAQLLERRREGFGRNYVIRREGRIVCHGGTYAEVPGLAVVSGIITDEKYRGQKLAYKVVSKLNHDLMQEGMRPCLFYFRESAVKLYGNLGFPVGESWGKLVRRRDAGGC